MLIRKPEYYDSFRCLAAQCPDSCCKEWDVYIDPDSAARYLSLPGQLGDRLRQVLHPADPGMEMTIEDGRCPMWRADGLCRIHAELGEGALCQVCREFPRLRHDYGDFAELQLELSCPEAARLIFENRNARIVTQQAENSGEPDYDTEAMASLLESREVALALLGAEENPPQQALALLLLYGYQAQGELDGVKSDIFDAAAALDNARELAKPGDTQGFLEFFSGLEILTQRWETLLRDPKRTAIGTDSLALARYLTERYWLQAVSDYDLVCRVKLIVISCLLVSLLGGDTVQTAQLFSKEIENNIDNVDAILDAAYTCPAFTDDKLLGMLLDI